MGPSKQKADHFDIGFFDFIVSLNSFDGATENRLAMNQDLTLTLGELMPELRQPAGSETTPKDDAPPEASLKSSPEAADATANSTTNAESTTDAEAVGASAPVGGSGEAVGGRAGRHPVRAT